MVSVRHSRAFESFSCRYFEPPLVGSFMAVSFSCACGAVHTERREQRSEEDAEPRGQSTGAGAAIRTLTAATSASDAFGLTLRIMRASLSSMPLFDFAAFAA